jgi:N-acyl homoserine lactone hydrolase
VPVGSNQGLLQIPMVYSAIVTAPSAPKREIFLVDTGFASGKSMTGRSFADFETPDAVLAKVEIEPREVKSILLTHLHFDHVGNIDAFPDATLILQRSEYERWKHALKSVADLPQNKQNWVLSSMNLDDIGKFDRAIADGRVNFVEGSCEIRTGLTLHLAADTHTFGCQWIEVATPDGPYAVASDTIVTYANLERMWPPGYHQGNAWNLMATYDRVKKLVGDDRLTRIVPGHDMELFRRVPHWTPGKNPVAEVRAAAGQSSFVAA